MKMPISKPKICFVAQYIYKILKPELGTFGGLEVQHFLVAKKLKELGYSIVFLVYDYGQSKRISIDGFQCIKTSKQERHIKYMRLSNLKKLFLLWKALEEADADIYYVPGCGSLVGIVAIFCKLKRKKFIFATASDIDVDLGNDFYSCTKPIERYLYSYGIRNADAVVVQTEYQKVQLEKNFSVKGIKISCGISITNHLVDTDKKEYILWVGSDSDVKQPQIVIELAKKISGVKFLMLGISPLGKKFSETLSDRLKNCPNVEYHKFIPYPQHLNYYDNAYLLVHTSLFEGFPNVFLEAWERAVPVVSLNVDPDECICKYKLGFHSRTFDNMISHVKLLLENEDLRAEMGKNSRRYVEENHNIDKIIYKYVELFDNLI